MRNPVAIVIIWASVTASGVVFAQKPVEQKAPQGGAAVQSGRETRTDEKREELSKKLLQRKNELRREDHERAKEKHSSDEHQKDAKKN